MNKIRSLILGSLLIITVSAPQLMVVGNPRTATDQKYALPTPTGSFQVGRRSFYWPDTTRAETMTKDPADKRELMVHLYYPTDLPKGPGTAQYCIGFDVLKSLLDPVRKKICESIKSNSVQDARISSRQAKYPVLVFSHGNEMATSLYAFIIEELASHGYIVAAIDHPYEALAVAYPNGRIAAYSEENRPKFGSPEFPKNDFRYYQEKIGLRVGDSIFVLDQLEKLNAGQFTDDFRGKLEMSKVGILGHSNGGMTSGQACLADRRFKAAVNFDGVAAGMPMLVADARFIADRAVPGLLGGYSEKPPEQPFMAMQRFMPPPSDDDLKRSGTTREAWNERQTDLRDRLTKLMGSVRGGSYLVIIKGATHSTFSDTPLIVSPDVLSKLEPHQDQPSQVVGKNTFGQALEDNLQRAALIGTYTLAFFDHVLLGKESPILTGKTSSEPLLSIERFSPR